MTDAARKASREEALATLAAPFSAGDTRRGLPVTPAALQQGLPLLVDAALEDEVLSLRLDAMKRQEGPSNLGGRHSIAVLHVHGDKIS